ncbi:MAG: ATP synthase epsilon chain [Chloroflexota bacterium]|nr:ATP synthase F1 subunit epsilon [Chloroflexota bacterium]NOG64735.1 ATP synthase F1 subunit epsilon [Chloroflexota bacterium]GIK66266.1 MAG: ATP synthase epsilon chain [Chloroflexota bacterium]
MPIHVEVVSQERKLFDEPNADMVIVPGVEGVLGILPRHTPLLTTMAFGELRIKKGGAEESFIIYGGVVEVRPDKVVVLADAADFTADVNLAEIEAARERARKVLDEGPPPEEHAHYAAELRRAELAINVARKTRSRAGGVRIVSQMDEPDKK